MIRLALARRGRFVGKGRAMGGSGREGGRKWRKVEREMRKEGVGCGGRGER